VGARMTAKILDRLRLPKKLSQKVITLVRYHLFYYDVGEVTERSVRRLLRKVGPENIDELLEVRIAERKGSGVPKAEPYRLRHLRYMLDKVARDPLSVGMLAVRGDEVMDRLKLEPGPKVGYILNALLEEVIDEPKKWRPLPYPVLCVAWQHHVTKRLDEQLYRNCTLRRNLKSEHYARKQYKCGACFAPRPHLLQVRA